MHLLTVLCFALIACATASPGRIVGGHDTTIELRPYQASLQYRSILGIFSHSCGASIISTKFLLSAAHCDPGSRISTLYARIGSTIVHQGGTVLKVDKYTVHPDNIYDFDYDYAIVSFASNIEIILGPTIQIIQLSRGEDPAVDSSVTVSGWGVTSETATTLPSILQEVDLPVWDTEVCRNVYNYLTARHMCLGGTSVGGTSACFGDSGGPVVQGSPPVQYALVTGGNSCSLPNIPGIYSRISAVLPWIKEITGI